MNNKLTDEFFEFFETSITEDIFGDISEVESEEYKSEVTTNLRKLKAWVSSHGGIVRREFYCSGFYRVCGDDHLDIDGHIFTGGDLIPETLIRHPEYGFPVGSSWGYVGFPFILFYFKDGTKALFNTRVDSHLANDYVENRERRKQRAIEEKRYNVSLSSVRNLRPMDILLYYREFSKD